MTPDRLNRFARHIVLPEVGGAGQMALSNAHVTMIGCGGIGSPALQYLAAAGIGAFTLIDDDTVEESNLQRQTIFATADLGAGKAQAAAAWIERFDPAIRVTTHPARITADNAATLIGSPTLVLDGCDNFATRLAVSDACVALGLPSPAPPWAVFRGRSPISRGICRVNPAIAAMSAMPLMRRIAIPAPPMACWAPLWGWWARWRR
jgi:molybdopterin/thiamine biosynthesis adenylyltransferase